MKKYDPVVVVSMSNYTNFSVQKKKRNGTMNFRAYCEDRGYEHYSDYSAPVD